MKNTIAIFHTNMKNSKNKYPFSIMHTEEEYPILLS